MTDRIAEVLRKHQKHECNLQCCRDAADFEAHVAERIEAELQLTEETRETDWYHDYLRDKKTERRWVSAWSEVES